MLLEEGRIAQVVPHRDHLVHLKGLYCVLERWERRQLCEIDINVVSSADEEYVERVCQYRGVRVDLAAGLRQVQCRGHSCCTTADGSVSRTTGCFALSRATVAQSDGDVLVCERIFPDLITELGGKAK